MSAISVLVPDPAATFVEARIASGQYASASDYLVELVLRDQPLSTEDAKWLEDFDASIARGVADSDAGRVFDAEDVLAELDARYDAMEAARGR